MAVIKGVAKNTPILKAFNYGFALITFVWLVAGAVFLYDTLQDRKKEFKPIGPMELYPSSELRPGTSIGIISPADHVKVLRVLFIDDHYAVQVQLATRQIGWILKPNDVGFK
jgi:hypothetical protein